MSFLSENYDLVEIEIGIKNGVVCLVIWCNYCHDKFLKRYPPSAVKFALKRGYIHMQCSKCKEKFMMCITEVDQKRLKECLEQLEIEK